MPVNSFENYPMSWKPTLQHSRKPLYQTLAEKAKELDLIILEDGINSLLPEHPLPPIAALAPDNTVYMLSLSKTILPALRLAYLHVPGRYTEALHNALYHLNLPQSSLLLELAGRLIVSGKLEKLLSDRRKGIIERNQIFDDILQGYTAHGEKECLSRWLILPEGMAGAAFEQMAREKGVSVYGSERFAVGKEVPVAAARLAICAPQTKEELKKGLQILKEILEGR